MALKMKQFAAGSCYSYILSSGKEAIIIDPHIGLKDAYVSYFKNNSLSLKYIIDTHTHADHFSLAMVLKKEFRAILLMHEKAVSEIADRRIKDDEELSLGADRTKFFYTPGHTDDAVSVFTGNMLFTGDVLLIGSVGRTDFQNGSPESMFDTLQRLKTLPGDVKVYPGHDYNGKSSSTIAREKTDNPFMKETDKGAFVANMRSKVIPKPFNIDNIIRVNRNGEAALIGMVSPGEARILAANEPSVRYIDVRSVTEFNDVHIKDALNIPIDMLMGRIDELARSGKSYIVLCRTGNRSPMAADMLMQSGIQSVKVLDGGMIRWQKEGLPVVKGVGGVSLERQVRAIAGILILIGIVLAYLVNRLFIAVPIFVSCGLIYSGLTDNCFMAMLLMKLPYNKKLYKVKLGGGTCSMG